MQTLWILWATLVTIGAIEASALFTPYVPVHPLDEGYFPRPKHFGVQTEHPYVRFPEEHRFVVPRGYLAPWQGHVEQQLLVPKGQYVSFVAGPSSLVAYVPVRAGSQGPWAVPNVFINGQGYSTNHYIAPSVMKKYLVQDPR
ncbi:uncharacterized protein LOC131211165 [Anopheles bellator]|uniref:uncharacterized protein LOC131211165 n=1 Tax=Anopheles bellator TaxID=139047 RepID=UPI0026494B0B|nr:uncharacterized protein LOC131211165 [Anopheles bellator]